MGQSRNERFVKLYWKDAKINVKDNDSYAPDLFMLNLGDKHLWNPDYDLLWQEAADYTHQQLKLIEDAEEQYYWLVDHTDDQENPVHQKSRKTLIYMAEVSIKGLKRGMIE